MAASGWNVALADVDFGEGAVVLPDGRVAFSEARSQRVVAFDGSDRRVIATLPGVVNGMTLGPDGALYTANNGGLSLTPDDVLWRAEPQIDGCIQRVGLDGSVSMHLDGLPGAPPHRLNDLVFGPGGRIYVTDSGNWETLIGGADPDAYRGGALLLVTPDREVVELDRPPGFPNGLAFTPDGSRLVVATTMSHRIWSYPVRGDGTLGPREEFADLTDPAVYPDGIRFDRSGRLYIAGSRSDDVVILAPDGRVERRIALGAGMRPTNLALAPGRLWVTTGISGMLGWLDVDAEPAAPFAAAARMS